MDWMRWARHRIVSQWTEIPRFAFCVPLGQWRLGRLSGADRGRAMRGKGTKKENKNRPPARDGMFDPQFGRPWQLGRRGVQDGTSPRPVASGWRYRRFLWEAEGRTKERKEAFSRLRLLRSGGNSRAIVCRALFPLTGHPPERAANSIGQPSGGKILDGVAC